jgi:aryl-alcohol dehydrogenase-like predicted oxidoreductase
VDRRVLGRTRASVSILGLGTGSMFRKAHQADPEEALALLEQAIGYGINYWDTALQYQTEAVLGPLVEQHRDKIFLVSKSPNRTYDGFRADLEKSLKNLRADHLDVYHLHNLNPKTDTDLDAIGQGAVRAARRAKEEGLIRHFGITGHSGAEILIQGIKRWDPDVLLTTFPCNRPDQGRYEDELLPLARERGMGVVAMKMIRHARDAELRGSDLIRYALSLPGITTGIVGLDSRAHLQENVAMTTRFRPLSEAKRSALTTDARTALAGTMAPWDRPGYRDA